MVVNHLIRGVRVGLTTLVYGFEHLAGDRHES